MKVECFFLVCWCIEEVYDMSFKTIYFWFVPFGGDFFSLCSMTLILGGGVDLCPPFGAFPKGGGG